jgi:hypothetical protein
VTCAALRCAALCRAACVPAGLSPCLPLACPLPHPCLSVPLPACPPACLSPCLPVPQLYSVALYVEGELAAKELGIRYRGGFFETDDDYCSALVDGAFEKVLVVSCQEPLLWHCSHYLSSLLDGCMAERGYPRMLLCCRGVHGHACVC